MVHNLLLLFVIVASCLCCVHVFGNKNIMEKFVEEVPSYQARKRKSDATRWKRNEEKVKRYVQNYFGITNVRRY